LFDVEFDNLVYFFDENASLLRQLGITELPYTILTNKNRELICRYPGYCMGADLIMCKKVRNCLADK